MVQSKVIVALDFDTPDRALALAQQLDPSACYVKVGKELFCRAGPTVVEQLNRMGHKVFLDLKFHDIPNTVAGACRAARDMGVWMVNVHASGGHRMMQAAREAVGEKGATDTPLLIAVTTLTSMSEEDLRRLGESESAGDKVLRLATATSESSLDGVVCSAQEAARLKQAFGPEFQLVTPGIRPVDAQADDQRRTMTPAQAQQVGVDYLVIGRPITASEDPLAALTRINQELHQND